MVAGHAALGAEDFENAERYFRTVLAKDETNAGAWYSLGRSLVGLDQENRAYDAFSSALTSAPDEAMTRRIHGRMGQIAACRLDLNTASAHYRSAGKTERAEEIESLATQFASALNRLERIRANRQRDPANGEGTRGVGRRPGRHRHARTGRIRAKQDHGN